MKARVVPIKTEIDMWEEKVAAELMEYEKNAGFDFLRKEFGTASYWEPLETTTQFTNERCKTVYLPLYVITYCFEHNTHIFVTFLHQLYFVSLSTFGVGSEWRDRSFLRNETLCS